MALKQVQLELTGPHAGKTIQLRKWKFVNGKLMLTGEESEVNRLVKFIGRNWQAYPVDSDKLRQAQGNGETDGQRDSEGAVREDSGDDSAEGVVQPGGEGPADEDADGGSGHVEPETGASGSDPSGDRHEDAGVPEESNQPAEVENSESVTEDSHVDQKLQDVIMSLDPNENEHWSEEGKPALAAVAEGYGSAGLTRQDIDAAAPDWNRDAAQLRDLA